MTARLSPLTPLLNLGQRSVIIRMQFRQAILLSCRARSVLQLHRQVGTAGGSCRALYFAQHSPHTRDARRRAYAEHSRCSSSDADHSCSSSSSSSSDDATNRGANGVVNSKPIGMDADGHLYTYLLQHTREPEVLRRLRAETARGMPTGARMQVSPEQGQLMALLVEAIGARRAVEIGTFTGYSSIAIAKALPESGSLVTIDRDERAVSMARRFWEAAGVSDKIDARIGEGVNVLQAMLPHEADAFDFAFIDADKRKNWEYYELMLQLVRPGGLILIDNVLFYGRVTDPQDDDKKVVAIRELNQRLLDDNRVTLSIVPVGDGIAICRRR